MAISAPWLLVGFSAAGVLHVLIPRNFIEKNLQKKGLSSVLKSSLFGIPLPLCSCSVIPVGASLRKSGASKGATASFFVSTPEIGVDSFLLSYALLGPWIAISRVLASFFSAIGVGLTIDKLDHDNQPSTGESCSSCCHKHNVPEKSIKSALRYGFVDIVDDLASTLSVGFVIAGLISVLVPDDFVSSMELSQTETMFIMLVISLPLYVCATSSTPLAASFLLKGINPGAILIFLLAGPASNAATMLTIKKELGTKSLLIYLLGIASVALLSGYILNFILEGDEKIVSLALVSNHAHLSWVHASAGLAVIGLLVTSLIKKSINRAKAEN